MAEQTAIENNIPKLAYITLEVGELSGFLPVFFHKYYPIVIENRPVLEGSKLNIISVAGEALCKDCSAMYNVMREEGRCPKCGSRSKTILGGQEFKIKEIGIPEIN
ncbi:MAG: hydrogenase maturation nickel metallochaperone HypA [Mogibacterium sp.]|nr:hydrogenase maturation nickel metallochaperone HypA [Mogibacterium sp.]MBQ6501769.1 hydrogenase maturation nickel metallochaperone HypA [Mogibacterium sp.]